MHTWHKTSHLRNIGENRPRYYLIGSAGSSRVTALLSPCIGVSCTLDPSVSCRDTIFENATSRTAKRLYKGVCGDGDEQRSVWSFIAPAMLFIFKCHHLVSCSDHMVSCFSLWVATASLTMLLFCYQGRLDSIYLSDLWICASCFMLDRWIPLRSILILLFDSCLLIQSKDLSFVRSSPQMILNHAHPQRTPPKHIPSGSASFATEASQVLTIPTIPTVGAGENTTN